MASQGPSTSALFQPLLLGAHTLSHRLVLAPLTRFRSTLEHVPHPFVAEYYAQRASVPGTLLITEATFISPRGSGYKHVPGIWNAEQIAAWRNVTDAVHEKGSFIFCQLWAIGRTAVPDVLKQETDGQYDLVSSSAVAEPGMEAKPPRALSDEEIWTFVQEYAQAARNAIEAGFDGVEIHGANGYLVDQFLQDVVNVRDDEWGGSTTKRARFALEVAKACVEAVGPEKVGIRLSPWSTFQGMGMKDPLPQFSHVIRGLKDLRLAYVHLVESRAVGPADIEKQPGDKTEDVWTTGNNDPLMRLWEEGGNERPVFVAGGFKPASAKRAVDEQYPGKNVCVVFGRYWISNPDLPFRIQHDLPLTQYDRTTFYKEESTEGYTDYPFSREFGRL